MNTHNSLKAAAKELKDAWEQDLNGGPEWADEVEQAEFNLKWPNLWNAINTILEFVENDGEENV
jgi:hypothetical protein